MSVRRKLHCGDAALCPRKYNDTDPDIYPACHPGLYWGSDYWDPNRLPREFDCKRDSTTHICSKRRDIVSRLRNALCESRLTCPELRRPRMPTLLGSTVPSHLPAQLEIMAVVAVLLRTVLFRLMSLLSRPMLCPSWFRTRQGRTSRLIRCLRRSYHTWVAWNMWSSKWAAMTF